MLSKSNLFNSRLSLWTSILINLLALCHTQDVVNILDSSEFIVQSRVRFIKQDSRTIDGEAEITEYYSNRLLRSRIEISPLTGLPTNATQEDIIIYYFSGASNEAKLVRETESNCSQADKRQFYTDLIALPDAEDFSSVRDSWFDTDPQSKSPHIIGLSRLLVSLQHDLDQPEIDATERTIRNRQCIRYTYRLKKPNLKSEASLYVYYQLRNESQRVDRTKDIPLRVWFELNDGAEILIDYMIVSQFHDFEYLNNDGLSRFAYPFNAKCLKDLPVTDLTRSMNIQSMSFLLQRISNLGLGTGRIWEFVAFDRLSKALRIDTIKESEKANPRRMFLISIIDLKLKRRFYIKQYRSTNLSETNRCIGRKYPSELMSSLPLPVDKLIRLGQAKVRGIETEAFVSFNLPETLYPSNQYDIDGSLIEEAQMSIDCSKDTCLVVYYFSKSGSVTDTKMGQLLRIEVLNDERIVERLEVQQFALELMDAPNGDSRNSLFSVRDRCRNNLTTLPIDFGADLKLASNLLTQDKLLNPTMKHLLNPMKLSRDLQRALISSTWIDAANLYDFMINPIYKTDELVIRIRAKLANLDEVPTYKVKYLGTSSANKARRMATVSDWNGCLVFLAHRNLRKDINPTFSFCESSCLLSWNRIDIDVDTKAGTGKCRVYELVKEDRYNFLLDGSYWNNLAENMQNLHLTVQLNDCIGCAESVVFDISRAYIESDDVEDIEQREVKELSQTLAGLGLSPDHSAEVFPPQIPEIDADTLEFGQPEMSLKICQYSCMSNLACKSYSLCSLPDKLECLISSADIRDRTLLQTISKTLKLNIGKTEIDMPLTWTDKLSAESDSNGTILYNLVLRIDKRCHTYTKRALDVFSRVESGHLMSAHSTGIEIISVNSRERCARECLEKNQDFFKQVAVVTQQLEANKKNAALDQIDVLESSKRKLDELLRSWCPHFAYLSKKSLSKLMLDYLQAHITSNKTAFCLLSSSKDTSLHRYDEHEAMTSMPLEMGDVKVQEFLYNNLFERRYQAVTLVSSSNSAKSILNEESRATVHNKNWQTTEYKESIEDCAKACFLQTTGLRPWCRSFSVLKPLKIQRPTICIYNSMTLKDILALGTEGEHLIRKLSPAEAPHYSHYDQRSGFIFDDYALARAETGLSLLNLVTGEHMSGFFRSLGVALVLILSIATGLFLAIKLSFFVQTKIASSRRLDLIQMHLPPDDE